METPSSSIRRVTRSQTLAAINSNNNKISSSSKTEESEKVASKSRQRNGKQQQDRSALIDITNDSPIVGVAMGNLETPSSNMAKQRSNYRAKMTPGSGEALLRGQVKTLLQKVEEEADFSKLSSDGRPFLHLQGFVNSPSGLLAPTPANTPQIPNLSCDRSNNSNGLDSFSPSLVVEEHIMITQVVNGIFEGKNQETLESEKNLITRSLLLDFSEKLDNCDSSECSSILTYQGIGGGESEGRGKPSGDDDDASVWSIQVNASIKDDDDDEDEAIEEEDEDYQYDEIEEEEKEEEEGLVDELCEGLNKMSVKEKITAKFTGKHTRFVYNSDDEIVEEEEEEVCGENEEGIMRLKGLPTPKGKHLRFPEEQED